MKRLAGHPLARGQQAHSRSNLFLIALAIAALAFGALLPARSANASGGPVISYVDQLYQDLLNRPADGPAAVYVSFLNTSGNTAVNRQQVATGLLLSAEYRTNLVQSFYQKFLGRAASSGEASSVVSLMQSGASDESVMSLILASPEYYAKAGSAIVPFVDQLYEDLLGRSGDSSAAPFVAFLTINGATTANRQAVALQILQSAEYRTDLVTSYFQKFLGRTPAPGEANTFVQLLANGAMDEQIISIILGSDEYFARTQVNAADPTTTTMVSSAPGGSTLGSPVTFTATVMDTFSNTPATSGSVVFSDNGATVTTIAVNASGQASFTGAPPTAGTHTITASYGGVTATYLPSTGTVTQTVTSVTPNGTAPAITSANTVTFVNGVFGSFTVTTTGTTPITLSEDNLLPPGVTFNAATGVISGTPTFSGTFFFNIKATNGIAPDASQAFALTVIDACSPTTKGCSQSLPPVTPTQPPPPTATPPIGSLLHKGV